MKRSLLALVLVLVAVVSAMAEVKVESLTWFDYSQTMDSNTTVAVDKGGAFYVPRAYVTIQGDIGKDWFGNGIKTRVTFDFAKSQFESSATAKSFPIKYAYIDYTVKLNSLITNEAGEEVAKENASLVFSAGQLKSYFGYIADWSYPIPVKDAVEAYSSIKPTASADFGVMFSGRVMPSDTMKNGLFNWYLQVLNGEGYEKLFSDTSAVSNGAVDNYAAQFTGFINVLPGVSLGGSYRYEAFNTSFKTVDAADIMLVAKDIMLGETVIPVDFLFQYITMSTGNATTPAASRVYTTGTVLSAMLGFGLLNSTVTPYVRYDMMDPNVSTAVTNDSRSYLYVGAKINPTKNLAVKPLFAYTMETSDINLKLELEYKIGFSLWQ